MNRAISIALITFSAIAISAVENRGFSSNPQFFAEPKFAREIDVTVTNLDIFVRDGEGHPVEGLTAEDFRVMQDGVEMEISHFAAISPEKNLAGIRAPKIGGTGVAAPLTTSQTGPLYLVLHIDNENLKVVNRNRVLAQMRTFVQEALFDPVQMMVVSSRRTLEVRQPFTNDPARVIDAMQRVMNESGARISRDRERRRILDWIGESDGIKRRCGSAASADVPPQVTMAQVRARILSYSAEETGVILDSLANMREAIRLVSCMKGRRVVVYVTGGLPMTPGLGLMHQYAAVFRDNTIYTRIAQRDCSQLYRSLAHAANRNHVSLYAVDAGGLVPLEGFSAEDRYVPASVVSPVSARNRQNPLTFMAGETGGVALVGASNVTAGLLLIRNDLFSYYSLGYNVPSKLDDTVHNIKVELPRHPDYGIRYRKWFVEKSLETKIRERVLQTLVRDLGQNPMDLRVTVGDPTDTGGGRWEIPLMLSFPVNSLVLEAEARDLVGQIGLFFCVRDAHGEGSQTQRREYEVRIPRAGYEPDRQQRYGISVRMLLKRKRHIVAVGLVDRVNRQTSYARTMVDFP